MSTIEIARKALQTKLKGASTTTLIFNPAPVMREYLPAK